MRISVLKLAVAVVGGLALLMAACAPAAESEETTTTTTTDTSDTTTTDTVLKTEEAVLPTLGETGSTTETTTEGPVSVGGTPLDPDAKTGGVLINHVSQESGRWMLWEQCCTHQHNAPLHDSLLRHRTWGEPDDVANAAYLEIHPNLASSWEQSEDGMQWILTLREGVKFHDGSTMTCEDVRWSLDTNRTAEGMRTSPRGAHLGAVESFECADATTLVVNMRRPKPAMLEVFAMGMLSIMPKAVYGGTDFEDARANPNISVGPFYVSEYLPGEKTTYTRFEDYWDQPLPYLDGIELRTMRGTSAVLAAIRAGRLDVTEQSNPNNTEILRNECDVCFEFPLTLNQGTNAALIPNFERYPWNLPEVRTAINLAVNRPEFTQIAYGREAGRTGLFMPGTGYEMPYERVKQIPGYDLERPREEAVAEAKALLAQAGFQPGDLSTTVTACTSPDYRPPLIAMIPMLAEVGINIEMAEAERVICYEGFETGNFDLAVHGGYFTMADPDGHLYEFNYPGSDRNYGRYSSEEAKRLIDLQSQTLDPEKRKEIAWDAAELIMRDVVRTFSGFGMSQTWINERLKGFIPAPAALRGHYQQHRNTWIDE